MATARQTAAACRCRGGRCDDRGGMPARSSPIAAVALARRHLALGLGPLVAGDRPAGIDDLLERGAARVAPHEELVRAGIDQLTPSRLPWRGLLRRGLLRPRLLRPGLGRGLPA